ncbi:TniQ family protein [Ruegeria sediminis]|uniref:TniQ family protein n=1 Tax=Ruegeria sediminis TaxID=2583820 RepID=UPI0014873759|nr:TniQ family protein [Ruegeria sediminis]
MNAPILPYEKESLLGFLRRMSETQGYSDVGEFLAGFGWRYGRPMIEEIEEVEKCLGAPEGALSRISPRAASDAPLLSWQFQRNHCATICPVCVRESIPHQQSWQHALVTACTRHDVQLVSKCPLCQNAIDPNKGGYRSCGCGLPFENFPIKKADQFDLAISALISGEVHPARSKLPPSLAFTSPNDIARLLMFLAGDALDQKTGKPGKAPYPKTAHDAREFLAPLEKVLCSWPDGFVAEVEQRLLRTERNTAPARLGKWYQRLMAFQDPAYTSFHETLKHVVANHFTGPYFGGTASDRHKRSWISAAEAARLIGVRAERIVDAVSAGLIEGKIDHSGFGHRHTMLPRHVAESTKAERESLLDKTKTREFLGISKNQFSLLEEAGVLEKTQPENRGPLVDGKYSQHELEKLVQGIASRARVFEGEAVEFRKVNLRFTTDKTGVIAFYQAVASGEISPAANSTSGAFADFAFPEEQVRQFLENFRSGGGWTVQELARITGWKEQCIAHWCDAGLIEHELNSHSRGVSRIIYPEALAAFQGTFVQVSSLAKHLNTTSRSLLKKFEENGIETVGAFQDGKATRGLLVAMSEIAKGLDRSLVTPVAGKSK